MHKGDSKGGPAEGEKKKLPGAALKSGGGKKRAVLGRGPLYYLIERGGRGRGKTTQQAFMDDGEEEIAYSTSKGGKHLGGGKEGKFSTMITCPRENVLPPARPGEQGVHQ